MKIDLGCGMNCRKGYAGLDIRAHPHVQYIHNLNSPQLPFKDNSIDAFSETNAFYELEDPMRVIKECHRCLKKGGILEIKEMYFASHYAYLPRTKNFWNFASVRIFQKGYRDGEDWIVENVDFEKSFLPPRWLVNLNRNFYEKYLSRVMPINYIMIRLRKR